MYRAEPMMQARVAYRFRWLALGSVVLACDANKAREQPVCPPPVACPAAPTPAPAPSAENAADTSDTIQIDAFDCSVMEPGSEATDPAAPGIATWRAGGPAGAAWNASHVVCVATVHTTCEAGQVSADLRIGKALTTSRSMEIQRRSAVFRFTLERAQWEKNFDEVARSSHAPYRTAIFRVTANLTCHKPYELAPGVGPRNEFAADRAFVAGFAQGE
jgi:hypothetical protein